MPQYSAIGPRIDSALLVAIIRQESAFNPADLSAENAMGLMQLTPAAGRDTCKRFGCKYDVKRLKNDSPYNLQVGAAELGGLLEEYGGNHILAFAAYNAGRGRVQEWIKHSAIPAMQIQSTGSSASLLRRRGITCSMSWRICTSTAHASEPRDG